MGRNATARLLYGFVLNEEESEKLDDEALGDIDEIQEKFGATWFTVNDGDTVIVHCAESEISWHVEEIDIGELLAKKTATNRNSLRTYCEHLGIEYQEPKWLLVADYG